MHSCAYRRKRKFLLSEGTRYGIGGFTLRERSGILLPDAHQRIGEFETFLTEIKTKGVVYP